MDAFNVSSCSCKGPERALSSTHNSPATMTEESIKTFGTTTPMKRAGQPVEVATCFVFLASADSSYIRRVLHLVIRKLMQLKMALSVTAAKSFT